MYSSVYPGLGTALGQMPSVFPNVMESPALSALRAPSAMERWSSSLCGPYSLPLPDASGVLSTRCPSWLNCFHSLPLHQQPSLLFPTNCSMLYRGIAPQSHLNDNAWRHRPSSDQVFGLAFPARVSTESSVSEDNVTASKSEKDSQPVSA